MTTDRETFTKLEGSNQEIKQAFWMMFDPSPAWSYLDKWTNEYFESQLLQKEKENQELKAEIERLKLK